MYVHALTKSSAKCRLVYVTGVTATGAAELPHAYPLLTHTEPWPVITAPEAARDASLRPLLPSENAPLRAAAYELPTCPVCLERLDASISGLVTGVCQHTFHCDCLQRWVDSRCPVCRYSQTRAGGLPRDESSSSIATTTRSSCCQQCGTSSDLWVCLICANVGCGRYKEGHAQQHFAETGHLYSLELETQRVWDYAGDGYVHRLIQSKTDGKLVELPSASDVTAAMPERLWNARLPAHTHDSMHEADTTLGHAREHRSATPGDMELLDEKMRALGLEYSNMILSQLDSQRVYYEGLLSVARSERIPREENERVREEVALLREQYAAAEARSAELQAEVARCNAQATRYETQLRRALESARTLKQERDEEKSVSDGLYQHVQKLQTEQKSLQSRVAELSEELRDLMFFVSARDKIEEADKVLPAESALHGGTVSLPEPEPEPASKPRKGKQRRT